MSGRGKDLTPDQRRDIADWWRRKQEIGTLKAQARRMNVSLRAITAVVSHFKNNGALLYANMTDGRRTSR